MNAITSPRPTKLADISPAYKVATEAYEIAAKHGCTDDALDALFAIVQREAKKAEALVSGGREGA